MEAVTELVVVGPLTNSMNLFAEAAICSMELMSTMFSNIVCTLVGNQEKNFFTDELFTGVVSQSS